jgi:hypothetical protein
MSDLKPLIQNRPGDAPATALSRIRMAIRRLSGPLPTAMKVVSVDTVVLIKQTPFDLLLRSAV